MENFITKPLTEPYVNLSIQMALIMQSGIKLIDNLMSNEKKATP